MVSPDVLTSLAWGVGLGGAYLAANFWALAWARRQASAQRFMAIVLGGMAVRLFVALLAALLLLLLVIDTALPFVLSFMALFFIGVIFEIRQVLQRPPIPEATSTDDTTPA